MTLEELINAGGPDAFIRDAAEKAAQEEARLWLSVLEKIEVDDHPLKGAIVASYIASLRRRLGVKRPLDEVRAMTRERVRRHRERRKAP